MFYFAAAAAVLVVVVAVAVLFLYLSCFSPLPLYSRLVAIYNFNANVEMNSGKHTAHTTARDRAAIINTNDKLYTYKQILFGFNLRSK